MHLCSNCATEIIPGAKFCHRCGEKFAEKTKPCPACQQKSPLGSVFCHHCGFHFEGKNGGHEIIYQSVFPLDFNPDTLTEQVKALFFKTLRQRVLEEHDVARYSDYVERFYQSQFKDIYEVRSEQIAEDALIQWERFGQEALPELDRRLEKAFDGLLDYFIIQYCPDLNGIVLPSAILKHEHARPDKTDLREMIHDFLHFERETEVIYFDFIKMPKELLANACKNFLTANAKERVYFICDLSLKGSCKDGFALTDKGIYWKAPYDKARRVSYADLYEVKRQKDWLSINGHFFTANPALNLKLCKLLKKLRGWKPAAAVAA